MKTNREELTIGLEEEDYLSGSVTRCNGQCKMLKAFHRTNLSNRLRYSTEEYSFTSKIFPCKNNKNIEWQLILKENTNPNDSNYISLELVINRSNIPELQVYFKCTLKKDSEQIQSVGDMCTLFPPRLNCVYIPNFVKKKTLSPLKLKHFEITCKIRALPKRSPDASKKILASDLCSLLRDEVLTDMTLIASNKELKAHKAILAARSPVFAKMFEHDMREKQESRVNIDDIEYEVMRTFLGFAYTGQLERNCEATAGALIVAAEKYQFEELKMASAELLVQRLNVNNAIDTLQLAERHNFTDLKLKVIEFINKHAKSIVKTPAFKTLTTTQAHLLAEIYSIMAMAVSDSNERHSISIKRLGRF